MVRFRYGKSMTLPGDHEDEDSSEDTIDPEKDRAEDEASKQRKRAGLPQITVDTLPSTIATKMLKLDCYLKFGCRPLVFQQLVFSLPSFVWGPLEPDPRTCLTKRVVKLEVGLKRFTDAASLTTLQSMILVSTGPISVVIYFTSVDQLVLFQLCFHFLGADSTIKSPRMKQKIEKTIGELTAAYSSIESKFNDGVVDGFTQESLT